VDMNVLNVGREGESKSITKRVAEKLQLLRKIDSIIDIGRSSVQLYILLLLGRRVNEEMTIHEITEAIGQRKRAVIDAIRKLESKGLIIRRENTYKLSEEGLKVYQGLVSILAHDTKDVDVKAYSLGLVRDVARSLASYAYLYDVIIALALSPKNMLPLKTLAKIVGISPQRLDDYLQSLQNLSSSTLLQRISVKKGVFYKLTEEGVKVFKSMPTYLKLKNNKGLRILALIARTGHPREVLRRVALIIAVGSAAIALSLLLFSQNLMFEIITCILWCLVSTLISLLIVTSY